MKFVLGYRTELFMIFLVPIQALQWYRFLRYSGTGSSAMMVPIRALRWYRLTDTINKNVVGLHVGIDDYGYGYYCLANEIHARLQVSRY